jgi:DNA primase
VKVRKVETSSQERETDGYEQRAQFFESFLLHRKHEALLDDLDTRNLEM